MWYNLMTDEERENTEFVINLSYGKDSLAAIHVAVDILKIPIWLIRIIHAEVWATDTIPADLPPMVEFKRWADGFIKGRWGLTVEHVCATPGGGVEGHLQPAILRLFWIRKERRLPQRFPIPAWLLVQTAQVWPRN